MDSLGGRGRLDDEVDDFLGNAVGEPEVEACDHHEAEHDGGGLEDLSAVRPLYALQLGPRCLEESDEAAGAARGRRPGARSGRGGAGAGLRGARGRAGGAGPAVVVVVQRLVVVEPVVDELVLVDRAVVAEVLLRLAGAEPAARGLVAGVVLGVELRAHRHVVVVRVRVDGHAARAGDERGVELVLVARGVLELAGNVRPVRLRRGRAGVLSRAARLALLGSLAVTGHDRSSAASGSPDGSCASGTTCSTCAA